MELRVLRYFLTVAREENITEEKTKQEFSRGQGTLSGVISISSGETQSMHTLSGGMAAFRKLYPLVQFAIYNANADDIKDRIENGLLDIGLLTEPVEISKYHFIRLPVKEQWIILTRNDSPLASKKEIYPQDKNYIVGTDQ